MCLRPCLIQGLRPQRPNLSLQTFLGIITATMRPEFLSSVTTAEDAVCFVCCMVKTKVLSSCKTGHTAKARLIKTRVYVCVPLNHQVQVYMDREKGPKPQLMGKVGPGDFRFCLFALDDALNADVPYITSNREFTMTQVRERPYRSYPYTAS